jgi:hypothetical protein
MPLFKCQWQPRQNTTLEEFLNHILQVIKCNLRRKEFRTQRECGWTCEFWHSHAQAPALTTPSRPARGHPRPFLLCHDLESGREVVKPTLGYPQQQKPLDLTLMDSKGGVGATQENSHQSGSALTGSWRGPEPKCPEPGGSRKFQASKLTGCYFKGCAEANSGRNSAQHNCLREGRSRQLTPPLCFLG